MFKFNNFLLVIGLFTLQSFIYGASISNADGFNSSQQNSDIKVKSITHFVADFLNTLLPSRVHVVSQARLKSSTQTTTTVQATGPVFTKENLSTMPLRESSLKNAINVQTTAIPSYWIDRTAVKSQSHSLLTLKNSSSTQPIKKDPQMVTQTHECGDGSETSCFTWRILKIVGAAAGAGFLVGLFSPVMFYFTITTIGCLGYGLIFVSLAIVCQASKGKEIGEICFSSCQQIGISSLQNMFSVFPILLTWLGSGCLVAWLIWPSF